MLGKSQPEVFDRFDAAREDGGVGHVEEVGVGKGVANTRDGVVEGGEVVEKF